MNFIFRPKTKQKNQNKSNNFQKPTLEIQEIQIKPQIKLQKHFQNPYQSYHIIEHHQIPTPKEFSFFKPKTKKSQIQNHEKFYHII